MKFKSKYETFLCIWGCRLQNIGHFASALIAFEYHFSSYFLTATIIYSLPLIHFCMHLNTIFQRWLRLCISILFKKNPVQYIGKLLLPRINYANTLKLTWNRNLSTIAANQHHKPPWLNTKWQRCETHFYKHDYLSLDLCYKIWSNSGK